jgi:predicted acylesterase/phospholipase RssA
MTIKHLVLSGGGPNGFTFVGILERLCNEGFWNIDELETIYATSVGAIIATCIALKYDWETLTNYLINRPWKDVFKVKPKHIIDSFSSKGIFNEEPIILGFKPLLEAKNLNVDISLKEFYEYSHIDLHFFSVEINSFQLIDINYKSFPELKLTKAILMTCCIPTLVQPIIDNNKCYVDGGLLCNYPVEQCIQDHPDTNEILGIKLTVSDSHNLGITEEANMLEFILQIIVNYFYHYTGKYINSCLLKYEVICVSDLLTLDFLKESVKSSECRKKLLEKGYEIADEYIKDVV